MPYIKKEDREHFEDVVQKLLEELFKSQGSQPVNPGELNYVISSVIWKAFDKNPCYINGNMLVGVLECVKQEFVRRRLNDYEDKKILENGDLKPI